MTTTPVFLPGEFHEQRSLVGYSLRGRKESDTTEATEHTNNHRNTERSSSPEFHHHITKGLLTRQAQLSRKKKKIQGISKGNKHNLKTLEQTSK